MKPVDAWQMRLGRTTLLEASAGTGKTYTLTTLYLRLLVEQALHPREILVVTYTQAATAELRDRIRARIREAIAAGEAAARGEPVDPDAEEALRLRALGERARSEAQQSGRVDPLRRALQDFDEAAIFTIHGFCQRTLQENAFESGLAFDAELCEAPRPLERALVHDLFHRLIAEEPPSFVEWLLEGEGGIWKFEPDSLHRQLLERLGADETMPLLPPRPETALPIDLLSTRLADALRAWAGIWADRREIVARALLEDEGLNRRSYKQETISTRWLPALDRLKRSIEGRPEDGALAALALPDAFAKLTAEAVAGGAKKNAKPLEDPCFGAISEVMTAREVLDEARNARALLLRHRFVEAAREAARQRREERHLLFFDDLLSELRAALARSPDDRLAIRLRERFRFALIDEFQDTDPVQYEIFRRIWHDGGAGESASGSGGAGRGLVLIGDPKQAIYSFRGADVFTYLAAHRDAGDAVFGLQTNWRSDPGLIGAVNALFGNRRDAFALEAIDFHPVHPREAPSAPFTAGSRSGAALRVLLPERAGAAEEALEKGGQWPTRFGRTTLAGAVASDIAGLLSSDAMLGDRPVEPSDIAILCRRKLELAYLRRALESLGIPCVDRGDDDVFETEEAWQLCCVLEAMIRPGDPGRLRAALATAAHGFDAAALVALDDEASGLAEISDRYAEYGRLWSRVGFARAFETWRREEGVTATLLGYRDGDRRLTNWLHLAELLQQRASERGASRQGLVAWLERVIASPEARGTLGGEASLLRLERDDEAVSLVTLHRSKGLEYPIVYLPSLWEGINGIGSGETGEKARRQEKEKDSRGEPVRFHDPESGRRTLDLAGHPDYRAHVGASEAEAFSEQLRLLYVGLTRAKHQCVVAFGAIGSGYTKTPLAWLLHGDGEASDRAEVAKAVKSWNDDDWRTAWERLALRCPDASISVEPADLTPGTRWPGRRSEERTLVPPAPRRPIPEPIRTTSFTAMVREGTREPQAVSPAELIGRDVDLERAWPGAEELEPLEQGGASLANGMDTFPRGASVGTLLHEVLEATDFADPSFRGPAPHDGAPRGPEGLVERASRALERGGLGPELLGPVLHMVEAVATTPLRPGPDPFCLADLAPGALRPEMEFTLAAPGDGEAGPIDPERLGRVLAEAPPGSPMARYAERAARLGFPPLEGFVRGFIDAVFFDGERYFLVDYKSNHLGSAERDYRPESLLAPMVEHDYVLQYLLYAIALDRHLARCVPDYDYGTHFGGVYYLFLRGLSAAHSPGCGVYFDRPEEAIVRGAGRLLGGHGEGSA